MSCVFNFKAGLIQVVNQLYNTELTAAACEVSQSVESRTDSVKICDDFKLCNWFCI